MYISSVYSPFSNGVGLPIYNIPSSGVLMKSIGAEYFRPDAFPGVNHMRGMQYQIVLNSIYICILYSLLIKQLFLLNTI